MEAKATELHRRNRKRDRNDPGFWDFTASVSAGSFGAARLPELVNLYVTSTVDNETGDHHLLVHERKTLLSGGGKRSSRHLRRRTTAFDSKKHRHRFPYQRGLVGNSNTVATPQGEEPTGGSTSGEHRPNGQQQPQPAYRGATRKSKRAKRAHLEAGHLKWLSRQNSGENEESLAASSPKNHWLVTHLWHSKRFHLFSQSPSPSAQFPSIFGKWTGIPLVHTNRGPRAALRLSQNKDDDSNISTVMIRDVTWEGQPIVVGACGKNSERFLLAQLGRICPGIAAVLLEPARLASFCSGNRSLEETIYSRDLFPSGAIGPSACRMLPALPNKTDLSNETELAFVEFRCHPAIFARIEKAIQQVEGNFPLRDLQLYKVPDLAASEIRVPMISFRLYGKESLNALGRVLKLSNGADLSTTIGDTEALCHGAIVPIDGCFVVAGNTDDPKSRIPCGEDGVMLIYRSPRPLDCPANEAISGWEVHCSNPVFAKALWVALVTLDSKANKPSPPVPTTEASTKESSSRTSIRGCCAIGLLEDFHMRMECEPPIPLFPRDFLDTPDSVRYWNPSSELSSSSSIRPLSWNRIRQLSEGGWGRLPIGKENCLDKLRDVDFAELVAAADSETNSDSESTEDSSEATRCSVVVVRGAFGQPFVDVIRGSCGSYKSSSSSSGEPRKRRRNRRPARPKNQTVVAPPLSKAMEASLVEYCETLSSSLSLPAIVLVHLRAVGTGRILPGMAIHCGNSESDTGGDSLFLGRVTSGGFSTSRGICHGIGAVGATLLLNYVGRTSGGTPSSERENKSRKSLGRVVRLANGTQSLQLLVRVVAYGAKENTHKTIGYGCEASLTALI